MASLKWQYSWSTLDPDEAQSLGSGLTREEDKIICSDFIE